jgi:phospholipid-binding lipoprotein MlaA
MSVPTLTAAMLLAGAPMNSGGLPPAVPMLLAAPAASDQEVRVPAAPAPAAEPPLPAAPAEGQTLKESAAPAPSRGMDQNDIVVTGRPHAPGDPLEKVNAKSFAATQAADKAIVGPVALAYKKHVPAPIRSGLRNFLYNLKEPDVFLNFLVQLKPGKAVETLGRFAINSTIGGAGLFDVAKRRPFKLPRRPNGFADSLGYYGVKPGPFLFLPLIGPTTVRDLVGGGLDRLVLPLSVGRPFNQLIYTVPIGVVSTLDHRAEFDEQLHKLHDGTADPYAASREFYLQRRQAEIDHLRGRDGATGSPAFGPTNPAIDPSTPPAPPATAPATEPSPGLGEKPAAATPPAAPILQGTSGSAPSMSGTAGDTIPN